MECEVCGYYNHALDLCCLPTPCSGKTAAAIEEANEAVEKKIHDDIMWDNIAFLEE